MRILILDEIRNDFKVSKNSEVSEIISNFFLRKGKSSCVYSMKKVEGDEDELQKAIQVARLIIVNGFYLEDWVVNSLLRWGFSGGRISERTGILFVGSKISDNSWQEFSDRGFFTFLTENFEVKGIEKALECANIFLELQEGVKKNIERKARKRI